MMEPTEGIAVSYAATQNCHSRNQLNKVVRHALKHNGYVGSTLDETYRQLCFDKATGWSRWLRLNQQEPNLKCFVEFHNFNR